MFVWIKAKVYEQDRNFQRFHITRMQQREQLSGPVPATKP
jgi:hypothetical protein